jgi:hypothetical protein
MLIVAMGISTPVCKLVKVSFNKLFCSCALHVAARALLFYPAKIIMITEYIGGKENNIRKYTKYSLNNISSCKVFTINCTQIYLNLTYLLQDI